MKSKANNSRSEIKGNMLHINLAESRIEFSKNDKIKFDNKNAHEVVISAIEEKMNTGKYDFIYVCLDTIKTILIPSEIYKEGSAEAYLAVNNVKYADGGQALALDTVDGVVVVIAWDNDIPQLMENKYGKKIIFSSPLLENMMSRHLPNSTILNFSHSNVYITVWKEFLAFADVFPCKTFPDLIYYLAILDEKFNMKKDSIYVRGYNAEETAVLLKEYYKAQIHEDHKW